MLHTRGGKQSSPCQPCFSRSSWGSQPPPPRPTLHHLLFPGGCWQGAVQPAMKMALASKGGSTRTWQKEPELSSGQAQALDTSSMPRALWPLEQWRAMGPSVPFLSESAPGFGEVQGLLRSPDYCRARLGIWMQTWPRDPSGCLRLSSPAPHNSSRGKDWSECLCGQQKWWWHGLPFPTSITAVPLGHCSAHRKSECHLRWSTPFFWERR